MRRSLVLEPSGFDMTGVEAWGPVTTLFPAGIPCAAHDPEFSLMLSDRLEEIRYNSKDDAFVVVGKLAKVARAISILTAFSPMLNMLYWDNARQTYKVVEC